MKDKMTLMTQTKQSASMVLLNDLGKDLTKNKPESVDNSDLLLSLFDQLNNLYEMINRLDHLLERTNINQIISPKEKGDNK
jgi:hypothetical protein